MIRARHHILLFPFFKYYVLWKMKRSFAACQIIEKVEDAGRPILWIANHLSWWDGIWVLYVNQKLFRRKFHFMMLEEQLRTNWFFQYTGGFSVKKGTRSIVESLKYASELLSNTQNMVLMFPQGEIQSMHNSSFVFEKGIERILGLSNSDVQVIFQANFIDYLSQPKPTLFCYLETYDGETSLELLNDSYSRFYSSCLTMQAAKKS